MAEADPAAAWFETVESRTVYEGFSKVLVETVRTPSGGSMDREIVAHDDAVAIVALNDKGEVILLKQYRQPVRRYVLEVPAGKTDVDGELPEQTARREMREEIGQDAQSFVHLTTINNSVGWTTERTFIYLATSLFDNPPPEGFEPKDEEADMEVVAVPLEAALEMVHAGSLSDAKTVVGLLLAAKHVI